MLICGCRPLLHQLITYICPGSFDPREEVARIHIAEINPRASSRVGFGACPSGAGVETSISRLLRVKRHLNQPASWDLDLSTVAFEF